MRIVGILLIVLGIVPLALPLFGSGLPVVAGHNDVTLYAIGACVMTLGIAVILACGDE
jgi:hypothetical protein